MQVSEGLDRETLTKLEEHTKEPTYGSFAADVVPEKSLNQTSEMFILDYIFFETRCQLIMFLSVLFAKW